MKRISMAEAVSKLLSGENVAFPTETVYGLAGDATNSQAVKGIFRAKGRPSDNPLIVHVDQAEALTPFVTAVSTMEKALMDAFWPGPFTIVLPIRTGILASEVSAGLDTVGFRVPNHPLTLELLKETKLPLAAPSANRSGKPSPTCADHVLQDLQDSIAGVIDGGECQVGIESTVVRCIENRVHILRPGTITAKQIEHVVRSHGGMVIEAKTDVTNKVPLNDSPRAPGMKYPHYAPNGEVNGFFVRENIDQFVEAIRSDLNKGHRVAVIGFKNTLDQIRNVDTHIECLELGADHEIQNALRNFYALLRICDQQEITKIWFEATDDAEIGAAYMNRLLKAANERLIEF